MSQTKSYKIYKKRKENLRIICSGTKEEKEKLIKEAKKIWGIK